MARKNAGWMTRNEARQLEGLASKEHKMIFNRTRSPFQGRRRPNYEIKAAEHGETTDVYIYDDVGVFGIEAELREVQQLRLTVQDADEQLLSVNCGATSQAKGNLASAKCQGESSGLWARVVLRVEAGQCFDVGDQLWGQVLGGVGLEIAFFAEPPVAWPAPARPPCES